MNHAEHENKESHDHSPDHGPDHSPDYGELLNGKRPQADSRLIYDILRSRSDRDESELVIASS